MTDFDLGQSRPLAFETNGAAFDRNDRWLAVATVTAVGGVDSNGVSDIYVMYLPDVLDADNDGLDDGWETFSTALTLPPISRLRASNDQVRRRHAPRGTQKRFLAEAPRLVLPYRGDARQSGPAAARLVLTFDTSTGTSSDARHRAAGRSVPLRVDGYPPE